MLTIPVYTNTSCLQWVSILILPALWYFEMFTAEIKPVMPSQFKTLYKFKYGMTHLKYTMI